MPHKSFILLINADFRSYRYCWSGSFILSFRLMKMAHPCWEILLWMTEPWYKNEREWSWWKKGWERNCEVEVHREGRVLTGGCRGGELHTESPGEWALPEKAEWANARVDRVERQRAANMCCIFRFTHNNVYVFSGQSGCFHTAS